MLYHSLPPQYFCSAFVTRVTIIIQVAELNTLTASYSNGSNSSYHHEARTVHSYSPVGAHMYLHHLTHGSTGPCESELYRDHFSHFARFNSVTHRQTDIHTHTHTHTQTMLCQDVHRNSPHLALLALQAMPAHNIKCVHRSQPNVNLPVNPIAPVNPVSPIGPLNP